MKAPTIAIVTALSLSLAACSSSGSSSDTASEGADNESPVGFSVAKLNDQAMVVMVNAVESEKKTQNVDILPATNANADPAKQNDDVSTLLTRGVKGLIVGPIDSAAIVPAIKKANEAKVPVVTIDSGADGGSIYMTVKADNKFMGQASCETLGKLVGGKGKVLNLQGDLASTNGRDRSDGFTECMAEKFPNIEVLSKRFDWSAEKCASVSQTVLSTDKIAGVYTASETGCLEPVTNALKGADRYAPVGDPKHMPFVGIDGTPEALAAVRSGHMDAVVSQPMTDYAKWAVHWVSEGMKGVTPTTGPTDHNSKVEKQGESYLDLLESPVVTKETVDDPDLWGNSKS